MHAFTSDIQIYLGNEKPNLNYMDITAFCQGNKESFACDTVITRANTQKPNY